MTCRDSESLILAERDGALSSEQRAALSDHVAACPSCQRLRAGAATALTAFKADIARVRVPDAAEAWRDLQGRLHESAKPTKKSPLAPVIWFGAPLAAAAAIALVFIVGGSPVAPPPSAKPAYAAVTAIDLPPPPAPVSQAPSLEPQVLAAIDFAANAAAITDEVVRADYVEAGDANALMMVYVDKESGWLVVWATDVTDTKTSG